uniref:type II toxin-antitoxin system Phd/YefM family antitoxin n=2 Tax=Streptococcus TaxID=1301 RepID=UPI000CF5D01B
MLNIRPVSDLRNRFSEIESDVIENGEPVFLTKNGYGSMVVMSLEQYSLLTDTREKALDEADQQATISSKRYTA